MSNLDLARLGSISLTLVRFLILGSVSRKQASEGRQALIFLDFAPLQTRQCQEKDFEKWYARSSEGQECLMGHRVGCETCSGLLAFG